MAHREDEDNTAPESSNLPARARGFSTSELEAVIRRAVELQAGSSTRGEEGVSGTDVVRIGQELGLEPAAVRRAMAEVRSGPAEEGGAMVSLVGERRARASRVIRRPEATVAARLDRYLRDVEFMVPQRRFPQRTRYVRDASFAAGLARFTRGFSRAHRPLDFQQLDVSVSALDEVSCLIEASVDLGTTRGGVFAGIMGSTGVATAGWATAVLATPIADPLLLLGVPALGAAWYGMRAIYAKVHGDAEEKLESFLDRVEHDELR